MCMVDLGLQVQRIVLKDPNVVKKFRECEKGSYKNQVWKKKFMEEHAWHLIVLSLDF